MAGFVSFIPPTYVEADPKHYILQLVKTFSMFFKKCDDHTVVPVNNNCLMSSKISLKCSNIPNHFIEWVFLVVLFKSVSRGATHGEFGQ